MIANRWCPKWIRRNYEIQNKEREDVVTAPASLVLLNAKGETGEQPEKGNTEDGEGRAFPP